MQNQNKNIFPFAMTLKALVFYIITIVLMGLFLWFIRGDMAGKMCAVIVCPLLIAYLIYAYNKEKKADSNALQINSLMMSGEYFESAKWYDDYYLYKNDHPFERIDSMSMKKDLLKRFRRSEYLLWMLFLLFLIFCCVVALAQSIGIIPIAGVFLFGALFCSQLSLYIGMPVRRWLKRDIDHDTLERSYLSGRILTYKKNGFIFGTTHIHAFTEKKIYAIDYELAEGISRKIVRLKKYEDGIYSSEEYKHYAVIHVRLPESGNIHDVEIELNEFQVQMVIDDFHLYKQENEFQTDIDLEESKENESVT